MLNVINMNKVQNNSCGREQSTVDMNCKTLSALLLVVAVAYSYHVEDDYDEDDIENEDEIDLMENEILYKLKHDPSSRRRRRSCSRRRRYSSCSVRHNGCGSDSTKNVPAPFKSTFKRACNKHDVCYNCGKERGWKQKECDDRFISDMSKICTCKYNKWWQITAKLDCLKYAGTYYGIVRAAGSGFYLKKSHDYCTNDCVLRRGSAELPL